jgi:hypothetical protein
MSLMRRANFFTVSGLSAMSAATIEADFGSQL